MVEVRTQHSSPLININNKGSVPLIKVYGLIGTCDYWVGPLIPFGGTHSSPFLEACYIII